MENNGKYQVLKIIYYITAGLNIFGSFLVIFIFWFFKEIRLLIYELIAWISLTCMIHQISIFLPGGNEVGKVPNFFCNAQGIVGLTFQKFYWFTCTYISYLLFLMGIKKDYIELYSTYYRIGFLLLGLILSLIFALIVFFKKMISFNGISCWLTNKDSIYPGQNDKDIFKMAFFSFLIDLFFILLNIYLFVKVYLLIKGPEKDNKELKRMFKTIKFIPIMKLICWTPSFVNILYIFEIQRENYIIMIILTIISGWYIISCSIIFIRLPHVKISIKSLFKQLSMGNKELELLEKKDFSDVGDEEMKKKNFDSGRSTN